MTLKKKYLIGSLLFVLVFTLLLVIASLFDLEISNILAGGGFRAGAYYSTNVFGRIFEYIGSWPIFILGIFACLVLMHKVYTFKNFVRYLALGFIVAILILSNKLYGDTFEYICQNHDILYVYKSTYSKVILWVMSIITTTLLVFYYRNVDEEKNNNLVRFALVVLFTFAFYLVISIIKGPVGRMRYRAMNSINDFSFFTNWYEISNAKELVAKEGYSVIKDGFKSFPSGHTFSAGVTYTLICMPYVFNKFNTKKWKVFWYVVPVIYTGIVGLSRIVVGAHFLSDVLVGGTIAYLASELAKYIFFIKKIEISKK